ncbi:MAG TPA: nitroreductase family deazaflavin-dependent oxidoreductase [Ktedonobacterales bacterium]
MRLRVRHGFMRAVDKLTQAAYHASGGRLGGRQLSYDILLLTTTGRKSGAARTHALLYIRDGTRYIICASNYGAPSHPAWYHNLRANPQAEMQASRLKVAVRAADASGEERERLWRQLVAVRASYTDYQRDNPRVIPVVILTPEG